jgi:hypothetical protein
MYSLDNMSVWNGIPIIKIEFISDVKNSYYTTCVWCGMSQLNLSSWWEKMSSYEAIKPSIQENNILWNRIFNSYRMPLQTHTVVAWTL